MSYSPSLPTSANSVVKPVHAKAMPVPLLTDADIETWLTAPTDDTLKLQKPAPDDAQGPVVTTQHNECGSRRRRWLVGPL
jgi:putative SOS response-associated peptidase YedK